MVTFNNSVGVSELQGLFSHLGQDQIMSLDQSAYYPFMTSGHGPLLVSAAQSAPLGSWQRGLVEEARGEKIKSFEKIVSIKTEMKSQYWGIYQPIMTALNELVLSFANENKGTSINANIIYPGAVNTKFRENIMPGEDKKEIKNPVDVAKSVVNFLLSNEKSGEIIKL